MRILLSGASGFVGSALSPHLHAQEHDVVPLLRKTSGQAGAESPWWNPNQGVVHLGGAAFDAIIHLAGESIVGRWTAEKKRRVRESRVKGTELLSRAVTEVPVKPKTFISASAIGFYGNRGDQWVDETSPPGSGFLGEVCQAWEAAADAAVKAGLRVVHLRIGLVLGRHGGALAKMLPAFRLGLGGRLGPGSQYWSWITIDDVVGAIAAILNNPGVQGPVNIVAPNPVTNREFTNVLGRVLLRPTFFSVPRFALRAAFGKEMAEEMFLASVRVRPRVLQERGYEFKFPTLEPALRHLLQRDSDSN
jgi:uncharacterized protein (TIGR01777 family)